MASSFSAIPDFSSNSINNAALSLLDYSNTG